MEISTNNFQLENRGIIFSQSQQIFPELDFLILSILDKKDLATIILISKKWKHLTFECLKIINIKKIKTFVDFLLIQPEINYCDESKILLKSILSNNWCAEQFKNCGTINSFKSKKYTDEIFRNLSLVEQDKIFKACFDSFLETITLISHEKKLMLKNDIELIGQKFYRKELLTLGGLYLEEIDKLALNIKKIPNLFYYGTLQDIKEGLFNSKIFAALKVLTCFNQIETALNLANLLPGDSGGKRSKAYDYITNYIHITNSNENFDRVINYLKTAKHFNKLDFFSRIVDQTTNFYLLNDDYVKSMKMINFYNESAQKEQGLIGILKVMKYQNKLDEALSLSNLITDVELRKWFIEKINQK